MKFSDIGKKTPGEKAFAHAIETLVVGAVAIAALIVLREPLIDLALRLTNDPTVFLAIAGLVSTSLTAGLAFFVKWLRAREGGVKDYVNE